MDEASPMIPRWYRERTRLPVKEMQTWGLIPGSERAPGEIATYSSILSEKSHGHWSSAGFSPWDLKDMDITEQASFAFMKAYLKMDPVISSVELVIWCGRKLPCNSSFPILSGTGIRY